MLYYLIRVFFTYYPSSAEVARTYADNVSRPLQHQLTPLRLVYYAYLLVGGVRLILNSILRKVYHQYDLSVYLFESAITHHMVGMAVLPCIGLFFVIDFTLVVRPHRKVAPMLVDLLQSEGKVLRNKF